MSGRSQFSTPVRAPAVREHLFPDGGGVVVMEMRTPGDPTQLLADEALAVQRAVPKRVQEFAAGRACARAALELLGVRNFALRAAADRQPVWPSGFIGSITHTTGFCAAGVAARGRLIGIGIDSEIVGAPTPDIWSTLCRPEELEWVNAQPGAERPAAVTLMFCAKEAFYKCQYPLTAEWLEFYDLSVQVDRWGVDHGGFRVGPTRPLAVEQLATSSFEGRYRFHEHFVTAGMSLGAPT